MDSEIFDFVTGNFPWDAGIDKEFMLRCKKLLTTNGTMLVITSASYVRGNDGKALRQSLSLNGNIKKIWIYPAEVFINPDTQKPIKSVGAGILYKKGEEQGITTLIRYMNGQVFDTTTKFNVDKGAMLYLGNEGNELWNKCCPKNCDTFPLIPYKDSTKPKIHFSSKLDLVYFGSSKPLGTITGKQLLTGVQIDLDGSNNWVPVLKIGDEDKNSAKRYMLEFSEKNMAWNAYFHLRMRVWGLMLGMTNTISHINSQSVGSMPFDILTGAYDNPEDYEEAYYKSKDLSPELIEWIKTVGTNAETKPLQNLKGDSNVREIERSAARVKITGELFTPRYHIDTILDTLEADGLCDSNKKVLEPSCGDGNFILAIIERKLKSGMSAVDALSTTYGCDLMQDNIDLCHKRTLELVGDTTEHREIVTKQIVCTDFFNWDYDNWCPKVLGSDLFDF